MGGSCGIVNSLDFYPASLKSLSRFYFRCVLSVFTMEGGDSEFASSKACLKAHSQSVSGNKQERCSCCRMPKNAAFSPRLNLQSSGQPKKRCKDTFFRILHHLSLVISHARQKWHLYCFTVLRSTSIVIHSVNQRLLSPEVAAATFRDFLRKRLGRAFTRANHLR